MKPSPRPASSSNFLSQTRTNQVTITLGQVSLLFSFGSLVGIRGRVDRRDNQLHTYISGGTHSLFTRKHLNGWQPSSSHEEVDPVEFEKKVALILATEAMYQLALLQLSKENHNA